MKRSEAKIRFIEFYEFQSHKNMRFTGEDFVEFLEELGFYPPDSIPNDDGTITLLWEPEEGWDEYLRFKEPPRTLPTSAISLYSGKPLVTRKHEMAIMWNNGSTIQEIADKFNVTRCRVETCLKKVERQLNGKEE